MQFPVQMEYNMYSRRIQVIHKIHPKWTLTAKALYSTAYYQYAPLLHILLDKFLEIVCM